MACACTSTTCSYSLTSGSHIQLLVLLLLGLSSWTCYGLGSFGFDIHHRFSDPVKQILGFDGLPEKGSVEYYAAIAHRDHIIKGRHLAASNNQSPLTFANGNETLFLNNFGSLYYANVSVGTPSLSYLVALDTGSDLFWLPCDCLNSNTCVAGLKTSSGQFNSQVTEKRYPSNSQIPFEYCYYLSANHTTPTVNLTMKGGDQYFVTDPTVLISTQAGYLYCLGLLQSDEGINLIGQNFMTGYRIVFNHDKMVLGWKASNCYNDLNSQTSPSTPSQSPALAVYPKSTAPSSHLSKLKAFTYTLVMLLVSFFAIV